MVSKVVSPFLWSSIGRCGLSSWSESFAARKGWEALGRLGVRLYDGQSSFWARVGPAWCVKGQVVNLFWPCGP